MRFISYAVNLSILLFCTSSLFAQAVVQDIIVADTVMAKRQQERSTQFYDNLKTRTSGSKFSKTLYSAIFRSSGGNFIEYSPDKALAKDIDYFSQFKDRKISNIYIYRNDVFDGAQSDNIVNRTGNAIHKTTTERVIRQHLLFKQGEAIDPKIMSINEQLIRDLAFISEAYIVITPNLEEEGGVDVLIFTRDRWSITATLESSPKSTYFVGVYDNNFWGSGNRLGLRTYLSPDNPMYGGNMVEYRMLNVRGTFFDVETVAGRGFDEYQYWGKVNKNFITPTDYGAGASLDRSRLFEPQLLQDDSVMLITRIKSQLWGGGSWYKDALNGSLFVTAGYRDFNYTGRPPVVADSNSYYHNRRSALVSVGLYREAFYRGNMIYAFGITEDIPYGHKFEFTGGRVWGEFGDSWYSALSLSTAKQTTIGYIRAEVNGSSHIYSSWNFRQMALKTNLTYFSNLLSWGRTGIRQFVNINYLRGFGRDYGEGEQLSFYGFPAPRKMGFKGNSRLVAQAETVAFTPLYFYGFRFAFYGFWDAGWLGDQNIVFRNDYFTTFGVGVRLRNERLIFNTIQIRLGFAFGRNGALDYTNFSYSSQQRLNLPLFRPVAPDTFTFR